MNYPVSEKALSKWCRDRLTVESESKAVHHYRFRYSGSTCTNGGTPFQAFLHVEVSPTDQTIISAWIEIPPEERSRGAAMCAAGSTTSFFEKLAAPASFCGSTLEQVIQAQVPVNYAGCFCSAAMVNEKWKAALSTVHYALQNNEKSPLGLSP